MTNIDFFSSLLIILDERGEVNKHKSEFGPFFLTVPTGVFVGVVLARPHLRNVALQPLLNAVPGLAAGGRDGDAGINRNERPGLSIGKKPNSDIPKGEQWDRLTAL